MSLDDQAGFLFLAENSNDVICRADGDLVLTYVSPSALHLLGWQPEEMIGKRLDDFLSAAGSPTLALNTLEIPRSATTSDADATDSMHTAAAAAIEANSAGSSPTAVRIFKKDGRIAWFEIKQRPLRNGETVVALQDVTDRKLLEERLYELTSKDSHMGLCTRRAFDRALEREWHRAVRETSRISLLLLDFELFQYLHTRSKHIEGDCCLEKTAAAVLGALRTSDIAAHYANEDIAVILPATGSGGAARVAEKVRATIRALRAPKSSNARTDATDVTIGMATVYGRPGAAPTMPALLLLAANFALRRAKLARAQSPRLPRSASTLPLSLI